MGVDAVIIMMATTRSDPMHDAALMRRGRIVLMGMPGFAVSQDSSF
jgi:ATP-dependent 26S proteasome regulatory subunit